MLNSLLQWCEFLRTGFYTAIVAFLGVIGYIFANYRKLSNIDIYLAVWGASLLFVLAILLLIGFYNQTKTLKKDI